MTEDSRENKITSFTDLTTWQKGHDLVVKTYEETKKFPEEEVYGITSQIRRSASSITANIAEGFGRQTYQEKVQFFYTAQGSLTEFKDQLLVARDVGYLKQDVFETLAEMANETHALLQGLIKKTKSLAEDHES
jgi:four helix bundle protein